jgi:alkylhydroperoxidase family enzyme
MRHCLAPVAEPYTPEVAALLAHYPKRRGYILQLFRTFANSPRFLKKAVANLLDDASPLPLRMREIVILRVTAKLDCEYEWGVHVTAFAEAAGLIGEKVNATRLGDTHSACWSAEESLLIRAVDELCGTGCIAPGTYDEVSKTWALDAQLEIIALCGNYHTICFVANTALLAPEPFAARFPAP